MPTKTKTVEFTKEKETKHTVKYAEVEVEGQPHVIGALYVQKWFAGSAEKVTVTIDLQ